MVAAQTVAVATRVAGMLAVAAMVAARTEAVAARATGMLAVVETDSAAAVAAMGVMPTALLD